MNFEKLFDELSGSSRRIFCVIFFPIYKEVDVSTLHPLHCIPLSFIQNESNDFEFIKKGMNANKRSHDAVVFHERKFIG